LEEGAITHAIERVIVCAVIVDDSENILVEELLRNNHVFAVLVKASLVSGALDGPGQGVVERVEEERKGPRDQHIVVDNDQVASEGGSETDTIESRVKGVPHVHVTLLDHLTEGELEEDHGDTEAKEAQEVGDEENGSTVLVEQVGESPQVTETDSTADGSDDEGRVVGPAVSFSFSVCFNSPVRVVAHQGFYFFHTL